MTNLEYYAHINTFERKWKESLGDYIDRYHAWMIMQGYIKE